MNDYRPYNTYNNRAYNTHYRQQSAIPIWDDLVRFAQDRPGVVIIGALVGGYLLSRYWGSNDQSSRYRGENSGYRPMWSYAPAQSDPDSLAYHQPRPRPADHMGATEDQMSNRFASPTRHDLEEGTMGTTGSAYELDPDSITAG